MNRTAPTPDYSDLIDGRHNGDSLSFARFSDEGFALMTTTLSGVISTEASFSTDRAGLRMFLVAAELLP